MTPQELEAKAREFAENWQANVKHYDCECSIDHLAECAAAFALTVQQEAYEDAAEGVQQIFCSINDFDKVTRDQIRPLQDKLRDFIKAIPSKASVSEGGKL